MAVGGSIAGKWRAAGFVAAMAAALLVAACSTAPILPKPSELPLSKETVALLARKGMTAEAPIFVRIFKEESELEIWKQREDGRFYHFKTYAICQWSGGLGPKIKQGDKQAPEGFYTVSAGQLNPNSSFYLAFNLGYPNAYDRVHNRTGDFLMVHGQCTSSGCYAMTDALMEEIYGLARDALRAGQKSFHVQALPFRMTDQNMARHATNMWYPFWTTLKEGYDAFERDRIPPEFTVCERRYVVNVLLPQSRVEPDRACPAFQRPVYEAFVPLPTSAQQLAAANGQRSDVAPPASPVVAPARAPAASVATPAVPAPVRATRPVPADRGTAGATTKATAQSTATAPAAATAPTPAPAEPQAGSSWTSSGVLRALGLGGN
jgi:murein L,D-transpeptidase YafK